MLQAGGFGVVAIDLADAPAPAMAAIPMTTWMRVQRMVEGSETACVIVASRPVARSAGGVTLMLDAGRQRAQWDGPAGHHRLLGCAVAGRVLSPRRTVDGQFQCRLAIGD